MSCVKRAADMDHKDAQDNLDALQKELEEAAKDETSEDESDLFEVRLRLCVCVLCGVGGGVCVYDVLRNKTLAVKTGACGQAQQTVDAQA